MSEETRTVIEKNLVARQQEMARCLTNELRYRDSKRQGERNSAPVYHRLAMAEYGEIVKLERALLS